MDGSLLFAPVPAIAGPPARHPENKVGSTLVAPSRNSGGTVAILLAIFGVALGLRIYNLGADALWHDELWGLEMTAGHDARQLTLPASGLLIAPPDFLSLDPATPWSQVWTHMRHDTHPPLFHLMLRGWRQLFGSGERGLRSMSVVWSMVAIVGLFDAVRVSSSSRAALWACGLMAVASPQILYGQEARSYAPLLAEGTLALSAVARLERYGPGIRRAVLLGAAVLAMALTHYFCAGAVATLLVYSIVRLRGRARVQSLSAVGLAVLAGLGLWGHEFLLQRANFAADDPLVSWLHEVSAHPHAAVLARLLLLPGRFLFDSTGIVRAGCAVLAGIWIFPALALRRSRGVLLWWGWLVGTVAPVAALDWLQHDKHLAMIRYTLLASPAVYVLLATAEDWLPNYCRATGRWIPGAVLIASVVALPTHAYHPSWRPDWRGMIGTVSSHRRPGEVVCCVGPCADGFWSPDGIYIELNYYLRPLTGPVVLFTDDPQSRSTADPADLMGRAPGAWAIVSGGGTDARWPPRGWRIDNTISYADAGTLEHLCPVAVAR